METLKLIADYTVILVVAVCGFIKIKTRFLRTPIFPERRSVRENAPWPDRGHHETYGRETTVNLHHFPVRILWTTSRTPKIPKIR